VELTEEIKKCPTCEVDKPLSEFSWRIKRRGLRQRCCKECEKARGKAYYAANRKEIAEKYRGKQKSGWKSWHKRNPDGHKKWAAENRRHIRNFQLKKNHGITLDQYESMAAAQCHKCAICDADAASNRRGVLAVDHCHETDRVRGLLCNKCNLLLGLCDDNLNVLHAAILYLQGDGS
jgi:hypothetical protein